LISHCGFYCWSMVMPHVFMSYDIPSRSMIEMCHTVRARKE
jgi:hypothetical protein